MIILLSGKRTYSLQELAERYSMSQRNMYRYLSFFRENGFIVEEIKGRYRLLANIPNSKQITQLFHFTEEEAYILYDALQKVEGGPYIQKHLVAKLHALYDFKALANLGDSPLLEIISSLREAMNQGRQVLLLSYRSSNSETITNRKVEPFEFLPDYSAVWCYDPDDQQCKQFKIDRMACVEILEASCRHTADHKASFVDAFRLSAQQPFDIIAANLSLKAYNLVIEEYPLSRPHILPKGVRYSLRIPVANYSGIGRFVMGLPGEIIVEESAGFKDYLADQAKKYFSLTAYGSEV